MVEGLLLKNTKYGTKGYVVIRIKIQIIIGQKGIRHESIQKLEKKKHMIIGVQWMIGRVKHNEQDEGVKIGRI